MSYNDTTVRVNSRASSAWRLKSRRSYGEANADKQFISDTCPAFLSLAGDFHLGPKRSRPV